MLSCLYKGCIVGLVVPALHVTRLLRDDLRGILDAPQEIKHLLDEVDSYADNLEQLQSIVKKPGWDQLGADTADKTQKVITSCQAACTGFRTQVKKWTKHSSDDGKMSRWDRIQFGFFEKEQVKTVQRHLQNGKSSLSNTVTIVNFFSTIHYGQVTEDIKQSMTAQQRDMGAAATALQDQMQVVQNSMADLSMSQMTNQEDEAVLLRQFAGEMAAIRNSQALLVDLVAKAKATQAQCTDASHQRGGATYYGYNDHGLQLRDSSGTINFGGTSK